MKRILLCFFLLLLGLVTGCGEPVEVDDSGVAIRWDGSPQPSWQEWAARQTQLHEDLPSYYRSVHAPEMDNWRPEDFLPAEYLEAPLHDICALPEEELLAVLLSRVEEPEGLKRLLEYAERGYVQAMMRLGDKFCSVPIGNPPALSRAEGLDWARRAAASGEPYAMFVLASCMSSIYIHRDHEATGLTPAEIDRNSLWINQMLYWYWRAAQGLEPMALYELYRWADNYYSPELHLPHTVEHRLGKPFEIYKWLRLSELGGALHGVRFGPGVTQGALERWPQMSEAEIAEAERRVEEFLRRYGGGLSRARYRGHGCPWDVSFYLLNQELVRYELRVAPERPWSPPSYPLPPLPG